MTAPDHTGESGCESIEALVARSSFGDSDARRARASTPARAAHAIYQRSTRTSSRNAATGRYASGSTRNTSIPKKRS